MREWTFAKRLISVIIQDKLTDLFGNRLLQTILNNGFCEMKPQTILAGVNGPAGVPGQEGSQVHHTGEPHFQENAPS